MHFTLHSALNFSIHYSILCQFKVTIFGTVYYIKELQIDRPHSIILDCQVGLQKRLVCIVIDRRNYEHYHCMVKPIDFDELRFFFYCSSICCGPFLLIIEWNGNFIWQCFLNKSFIFAIFSKMNRYIVNPKFFKILKLPDY